MDANVESVPLRTALGTLVRHPFTLLRSWNWKAAAFSAIVRGGIFLVANRHAARAAMAAAVATELVYATFAAGVAGSVTQRLRHAEPEGRTAVVVWLVVPLLMSVAQYGVHRMLGTPHLRAGLIASFVFAAFASGFNWFAMRRGAFVTGAERSFAHDMLLTPKLIAQFVAAPFRRSRV